MVENVKARADATRSVNEQSRGSRMLEGRSDLNNDELDSLDRKESYGCVMEIVRCKVADTKGKMISLVNGLLQGTLDS